MTEKEWLGSTDPETMLNFLGSKASDRKLRCFLIACARRVLPPSPDKEVMEALDTAERFADGLTSRRDLARSSSSLKKSHSARMSRWSPLYTDHIRSVPAWHATREQIVRGANEGARCCAWSSTRKIGFGGFVTMKLPTEELTAQASLLRDIFGNPFRPVTKDPAWLTSTVTALAEVIYTERASDRMPILGDALEDAGCTNQEILGHCRGPGPHVRGCWVVDLLLGKE